MVLSIYRRRREDGVRSHVPSIYESARRECGLRERRRKESKSVEASPTRGRQGRLLKYNPGRRAGNPRTVSSDMI
jgi:hypothetical protein